MAEIKPYDDQRHREQVLNLFADVAFKRDIWSYQFQENPGARDRGFAPVVAEENGSVVGFNGVVPVSILWNGRPTQAMWSCDFKVSERQRGKGVGRLIKVELAQRSPILMSFGISRSPPLYCSGWVGVPATRCIFFVKSVSLVALVTGL